MTVLKLHICTGMLALKASSFLLMLVACPVQDIMLPEQLNDVKKSFLALSCVNMDWISIISNPCWRVIHSILTCQGIALAFRKKKVLYH